MQDLIMDAVPFEYELSEAEDGSLCVRGIFARAEVKNANGRLYPRSVLESAINSPDVKQALNERRMFGELDHPQDGTTKLSRVSHIMRSIKINPDGTVFGEAEILSTPNGKILRELFESGVQVGVSSRGKGSLRKHGDTLYVNEGYKLQAFDFVARPSTPGAFPKAVDESGTRARLRRVREDVTEDSALTLEMSPEQAMYELNVMLEDAQVPLTKETAHMIRSRSLDIISEVLADDKVSRQIKNMLLETRSEILSSLELTELEENNMNRDDLLRNKLQTVLAESDVEQDENTDVLEALSEEISGLEDEELIALALQEGVISEEEAYQLYPEMFEAAEEDVLEYLNNLSDEELIGLALENEVLSLSDLQEMLDEDDEDDAAEDGDADLQALLDDVDDLLREHEEIVKYAAGLEQVVVEQEEVIGEVQEIIESGGADGDLMLKYEAALRLVHGLTEDLDALVEAVGGAEKASELIEAVRAEGDHSKSESETNESVQNTAHETITEDRKRFSGATIEEMAALSASSLERLGLQ